MFSNLQLSLDIFHSLIIYRNMYEAHDNAYN